MPNLPPAFPGDSVDSPGPKSSLSGIRLRFDPLGYWEQDSRAEYGPPRRSFVAIVER
jgi:hypothetical protein